MPSAMDALKGDVNALESFFAAAMLRKSPNEKSLAALTMVCSPAVSWRGRFSTGAGCAPPPGPGSVAEEQAARRAKLTAATLLLRDMTHRGSGYLAQPNRPASGHLEQTLSSRAQRGTCSSAR